jgi:hypothetical protein
MANLTPWINYGNGDNLVDIRTKLNSFNTEVNAQVDANTADITALQTDVVTNTADITAAEDAILANAIGVVDNAADIVTLETKVDTNAPFAPSYSYATGSSIVVASTTYANILTLTTGTLEAGVYELSQSMLYSLDSTNNSAFFRFSTNGGATWSEIRREPKDNADILPHTYITTIVHAGGVFEIQIEARKEALGDTLTVSAIDAIFERKV